MVLCSFGDASGSGFGSSIVTPASIQFRYGLWGVDLRTCLSNYRELFDLYETAEAEVATLSFAHLAHLSHTLEQMPAAKLSFGAELFLFTDNGVAERLQGDLV